MQPPIFVISGPPAVGKTTVSRELLQRFERGIHIPVDDLREWVVKGIAHPVGWTEETSRQFAIAEQGAADLAIRYQDSGFAVAIDHCQGPPTLDKLVAERFSSRKVFKVALMCPLELNLERNRTRTGKWFEPDVLTPTIHHLNNLYATEPIAELGWHLVQNGGTIEETVASIMAIASREG